MNYAIHGNVKWKTKRSYIPNKTRQIDIDVARILANSEAEELIAALAPGTGRNVRAFSSCSAAEAYTQK